MPKKSVGSGWIPKYVMDGEGRWGKDPIQSLLRDLKPYPPFRGPTQAREFFERMQCAQEPRRSQLREEFLLRNIRLVIMQAFVYVNRGTRVGLQVSDLVQEGYTGLDRALEKYNPAHGVAFSTYAVQWIRQRIRRALVNYDARSGGRVPVHVHELQAQLVKVADELRDVHGSRPTSGDLYLRIKAVAEESGQTPPTLKQVGLALRNLRQSTVSMDEQLPSDEGDAGRTRHSSIEDPRPLTGVAFIEAANQLQEVDAALQLVEEYVSGMNPRDGLILTLRFGLSGRVEQTLEQVGQRIGVTRERVRQIQVKALRQVEEATGFGEADIRGILRIHEELTRLVAANA